MELGLSLNLGASTASAEFTIPGGNGSFVANGSDWDLVVTSPASLVGTYGPITSATLNLGRPIRFKDQTVAEGPTNTFTGTAAGILSPTAYPAQTIQQWLLNDVAQPTPTPSNVFTDASTASVKWTDDTINVNGVCVDLNGNDARVVTVEARAASGGVSVGTPQTAISDTSATSAGYSGTADVTGGAGTVGVLLVAAQANNLVMDASLWTATLGGVSMDLSASRSSTTTFGASTAIFLIKQPAAGSGVVVDVQTNSQSARAMQAFYVELGNVDQITTVGATASEGFTGFNEANYDVSITPTNITSHILALVANRQSTGGESFAPVSGSTELIEGQTGTANYNDVVAAVMERAAGVTSPISVGAVRTGAGDNSGTIVAVEYLEA